MFLVSFSVFNRSYKRSVMDFTGGATRVSRCSCWVHRNWEKTWNVIRYNFIVSDEKPKRARLQRRAFQQPRSPHDGNIPLKRATGLLQPLLLFDESLTARNLLRSSLSGSRSRIGPPADRVSPYDFTRKDIRNFYKRKEIH